MTQQSSVRIMDVLSEDQQALLRELGSPVSFAAEQTVFLEGQPSRSVLIIEHGNLKVTRRAADGAEIILAIRGEGEVIGEEGVLMGEGRDATVTAITDVGGLDIAADQLLGFVEDQRLWPLMYQAAVRRRRQSDQRALLARLDVKNRLARWLLELVAEVGREVEEGWAIETTLSQRDLAGRIGASRDAVAIELRRLRESGLVSTGRHRIIVHDLDAVRLISTT